MSDKCLLCDREQPDGEPWSWYEPEHLEFGFNLCPKCDKLSNANINKKFKEKYSPNLNKENQE